MYAAAGGASLAGRKVMPNISVLIKYIKKGI